MLENARRQLVLVLLTVLGAVLLSIFVTPALGTDVKGGIQLIYEVPEEHLKKQEKETGTKPDVTMSETVAVISDRIDPTGTIGALVSRRGHNGVLIELPYMEPAALESIEANIQSLGKLEMRIVAHDDSKGPTKFNTADEKARLQKWLDDGGKALVLDDWRTIERFNGTPSDQGGPAAFGKLAWFAHIVSPKSDSTWNYSFAKSSNNLLPSVAVFDDAAWNAGVIPPNADRKKGLLEFLAMDMSERHFTGQDLDSSGISAGPSQDGSPAVHYRLKSDLGSEYGDWSQRYIGKHSAIILNNVVKSAPVFKSRIPGSGIIEGDFTQREVDDLVKVLRTGSLKVEPEFQSKSVIGATLGERSIKLGLLSMAAGALAVFVFMLFYYRLAGVVACVTLVLNVALLYAAMLISQATITLPGLGGIVLTMGMAVDANVLIYERIREELEKGKDMLRAVRAGFERAMVTILDANITTFLVGLVLYGVGTGPVRGFAVTLMWGIVTTVFTQFFVTRLVFHYMLERKLLTSYRTKSWFTNLNVNYTRHITKCVLISGAVILAGLIHAATVRSDDMLGLDFTGGANLQMVLEQRTTAEAVRATLAGDPEFRQQFHNPEVNTIGAEPDGQAYTFNLRLKLTDELRAQIDEERRQWRLKKEAAVLANEPPPPDYAPPYLAHLKRLFAGKLVQPAFSGASVLPRGQEGLAYAEISLHFREPVSLAAVKDQFQKARLLETSVKPEAPADPNATESRHLFIEWNVLANVKPNELYGVVRKALEGLKSTSGQPVELSNPFPEAEEIGGRMVGELRTAAIGALILSWALIILYLRVRFHEYKYGIAAVIALVHDVLVTFGVVVLCNRLGIVHAEIDLNMIACFLTIIGYSVNDTIVVFDRFRENLAEEARLGEREPFAALINRSLNQTMSRTILTSGVTMCAVLAQFLVNWGSGSALESFAFAMLVGMVAGVYSSIYIAAPLLLWLRGREGAGASGGSGHGTAGKPAPQPAATAR